MAGYVEGVSSDQATLFPERLDELIKPDAQVRVVDLFVTTLDLEELKFTNYSSADGDVKGPFNVGPAPGDGFVGSLTS